MKKRTSPVSASISALARMLDATMTAPGAPTFTPPSTGEGTTTGGTGEGAGTGTTTTGGVPDAQDVGSLPQWAQNLYSELRRENAGHRTAKNTAEQAKADAEKAKNEVIEAAKVALGLSEAPSPEQLGSQLAEAQAETRRARIETAIARDAAAHGGDLAALLDSQSFLRSAHALDPTAADFATKLGDAIKGAVTANSRLAATTTTQTTGQQTGSTGARRPAPDHSQGSGGSGHSTRKTSVQTGREEYQRRHGKQTAAGT